MSGIRPGEWPRSGVKVRHPFAEGTSLTRRHTVACAEVFISRPYLPSLVLRDYLHTVATLHPQLHELFDFGRPGAGEALAELAGTVSEFDTDSTGRGDSYRRAQRDTLVRWTGMRRLLDLATPGAPPRSR